MRNLIALLSSGAWATFALAGVATPATITTGGGSGISQIVVVTNTASFATASPTYVNVTGASGSITVKEGGLIRARFSAESRCGGGDSALSGNTCSMRVIVVGGAVANPKSSLDFAFDSYDGVCCTEVTPEAHSMEWVSGQLPAGTYTVRAQAAVVGFLTFTLDDWTYSLEAIDP